MASHRPVTVTDPAGRQHQMSRWQFDRLCAGRKGWRITVDEHGNAVSSRTRKPKPPAELEEK